MGLALSLKFTSEGPLPLVMCSLAYSRAVEAKLPFFELPERAARQSHRARQGSNPRRDRGYLNGRYREGFRMPAMHERWTRYSAGVRKPPKNERAKAPSEGSRRWSALHPWRT